MDTSRPAIAEPILAPLAEGHVLAERFRIERFLECKHGANLYRALDLTTELVTILKEQPDAPGTGRLDPALVTGELGVELPAGAQSNPFRGEFAILRAVSYPTVVKAVDLFSEGERAYLVIEQLEGRDLGYYLTQRPVSVQQSIEWMIQLCQSLSQLHRRGIVHLDLQPRAIVVAPDEQRVRLTGFHRACLGPLPANTPVGYSAGYASPEQVGAVAETIDARADVYGLGAVWFQLLTGQAPAGLAQPTGEAYFPPVSEHAASLHPQVARIVMRMLDPEAAYRYASVTEVKNELLTLINNPARRVGHFSDLGMVREGNEDSLGMLEHEVIHLSQRRALGFYIVADGMGGVNAGEVASQLAVSEGLSTLDSRLDAAALEEADDPAALVLDALENAVKRANNVIYETGRGHEVLSGMGTTMTAAVVQGQTLYCGHVGDSRCYVINRWGIEKISRDHSLVGRLVEIGQITEDEALVHPQRNLIYRALGTYPNVEVDLYQRALKLGDWVLLCSDGLTGLVKDHELQSIVLGHDDPQRAAQHLVNVANARGGDDNITVVLIHLAEYA